MRTLFLLAVLCVHTLFATAAITYDLSGGRFGDNVLAYLHAKWLSYQHEIPLIYRPFGYSEKLVMHTQELQQGSAPAYNRIFALRKKYPEPMPSSSYCFVCPYFPEVASELENSKYFSFEVDWKDPVFRKMALAMIAPQEPVMLVNLPKDTINVAVHVREGGGFDGANFTFQNPLKSPPLHFYVDALHQVFERFKDQPLYCHFFTDAQKPADVIEQIIRQLPARSDCRYEYRKEKNHHGLNVLEDFFSLFQFDVLVRPESHFSIVPGLLHDYQMVCYPKSFVRQGREVRIDQIGVVYLLSD